MGSSGGVPPGFRFHPTDEELLHYYLKKKISFSKFDMEVIREVDLNKIEPWDLEEKCRIGSSRVQNDWYFFSHKDRKYPTGSRTNRATSAGFWKATGRDKCIRNSFKKIGMRKTLVFYRGRAPHGQKTDWIMHEYRLEDTDPHQSNHDVNPSVTEDGWVVCRVFKKKNLFKVGSGTGGGGGTSSSTSITSDHHQQQQHQHFMINTSNLNIPTMHGNHQHYQQHHHHLLLGNNNNPHDDLNGTSFDLYMNNKIIVDGQNNHLSLNYPNSMPLPHPAVAYDLYSSNLPSDSPLMLKQLMSNTNMAQESDCGGGGANANHDDHHHHNFRYQQPCETSGLDIGTCDPVTNQSNNNMVATGSSTHQWGMQLDRDLVTASHHDHDQHQHQQDGGSKDQHHSLRGEMDFWGYQK